MEREYTTEVTTEYNTGERDYPVTKKRVELEDTLEEYNS